MNVFNIIENGWNWFREGTFDTIAEHVGVKYKEVLGLDYEIIDGGYKVYPADSFLDRIERRDQFEADAKSNSPILFFIYRTLPDFLEDVVLSPETFYKKIRDYVKYNFIKKYHIVNTGLPPGYYDTDTRILYGVRQLLFDFIEIECHNMYIWSGLPVEDEDQNYGLKYLMLSMEDELGDQAIPNIPSLQAIIGSYNYFKTERPRLEAEIDNINIVKDKASKKYFKLQEQLYNLDTKHLNSIIKNRSILWT